MIDFEKITNEYYSQMLGIDKIELNNKVNTFFNSARDNKITGYSYSMGIFILVIDKTINISYGIKTKDIMEKLMENIQENCEINQIKTVLETISQIKVKHSVKYAYRNIIDIKNNSIRLGKEHFPLFLTFFKKNNSNVKDYSWVEDYFLEIVEKNYCHGVIIDGILVCVTDAPNMPYMSDKVQEIGINTLEEYRGKGYATMACISMINELVNNNLCPIWSTDIENIGSDKLAKKVGFEKYCDVLTINI